ncbi:hypothetical protein QYM46_12950 [Brevibacterium sp. K11IcPPYGO002]|uniref:hypothetical protein n=1 Tax=Brevibacterium sp. K11IcPPYGO002 TaxID=3058837 RepID=UPI003D8128EE
MRPAIGQIAVLLVLLIVIAAVIAGIVFGIVKLVKYMRRREADRREMLGLMREQNRRQ